MSTLQNAFFEIERRSILFKPTTTLPDNSLLGFDGDPNSIVSPANDGEFLIYHSPTGTGYMNSVGDKYQKTSLPNVWLKEAFGESSDIGKVAVDGGVVGWLEETLQAGDNINLIVDNNNLIVSSIDKLSEHETFTIASLDVTNKYVTTTYDILDDNYLTVSVVGGTTLKKDVDYSINGNNIEWDGLALDGLIDVGDILNVTYTRESSSPGLLTDYRSILVDENYAASVGNELLVDSSTGPINITLPLNPNPFDKIKIIDIKGIFNTNNVTLLRNGKLIKETDEDLILDIDGMEITMIYLDDIYGWSFKTS